MAFNNYPYTDFHELNADWIMKTVAELEGRVTILEQESGGGVSIEPTLQSGEKIADFTIGEDTGELYAPEGTVVEVTPVVTEGTKIAEISVDGTVNEIYASSFDGYDLDDEFIFGTLTGSTVYGKLVEASFGGSGYTDVTLPSDCSIIWAGAYLFNSSSSWVKGLMYQNAYKVRILADSSNSGKAKVLVLYTKVS